MFVPILMGSKVDETHAQEIAKHLEPFGIEVEMYIASAHKVPELVLDLINEVNNNGKPTVWITIAGRSNALSGVVSANTIHPVLACPPFKDRVDYLTNIHSSVMMPSDTPSMVVVDPQNAAMAAIRILALTDKKLQKQVEKHIQEVKESF